jgi:ribonuclease Y
MIWTIVAAVLGLAAGVGATQFLLVRRAQAIKAKAKVDAGKIIRDAKREAENTMKESQIKAKEVVVQAKQEFDRNTQNTRRELQKVEQRLDSKEENLTKKEQQLSKLESDLSRKTTEVSDKSNALDRRAQEYNQLMSEAKAKLERVANISAAEAKQMLMDAVENETKIEAARKAKKIEDEARELAEGKAKRIISIAISRFAGEYVSERTVSVVSLPSDEMKGRIIGREGRNIRAIEAATGCDLIIDDTPEAIIVSGFDPVRREVARQALQRLCSDGRIHPARIEEVVEKTTQELNTIIKEAGQQALYELGLHGIHPEIQRLIGSLKYRTSYTQNQYSHVIEVAWIAGLMAEELGLDVKLARRAALLHDIGKAIDHSIEGSHAVIGADFAKKYNEHPDIVHAIRSHHEDEKPASALAFITQAADALSGARPGARREMMESYVKRVEEIENISNSFDGVERSFAIQAGREVRVLVQNSKVTDEMSDVLARDIAHKIEENVVYPGTVKVTVIRETRSQAIAR